MILSRRTLLAGLTLALWLGLVATGFAFWERYESIPGRIGPAEDAHHPPGGGWELVLFVHPHCPCSRASLQELAELVSRSGPNVAIRVVFVRPPGVPDGWEHSELWDQAASIPGVHVSCDSDGRETRRAGAATSGHLVVYDPMGRIAFKGGITRGRGQEGESPARKEILELLANGRSAVKQTPVFGCELFNSDACENR